MIYTITKPITIAALVYSMAIITGCGKQLENDTEYIKIKDIQPSENIVPYHFEKEREGSVIINGVKISVSCPQGWDINVMDYDETTTNNSLHAFHFNTPEYDLTIEKENYLVDENYDDISASLIKKASSMTTNELNMKNFDISVIKDMQEAYEYFLTKDYAFTWSEVSFGKRTFNHQVYVTAKGKLKALNKNIREQGSYWYITIFDKNIFEFQFTSENPNIDDSVISIFEKIMQSVSYE